MDIDAIFESMRKTRNKLDCDDYIHSEEGLHCPHCSHFHDANDLPPCDYPEVWQEDDSRSVVFECHECGLEFVFSVNIAFSWDVVKPEPSESAQGLIPIPDGYAEQ